jgi:hypothetical protein
MCKWLRRKTSLEVLLHQASGTTEKEPGKKLAEERG